MLFLRRVGCLALSRGPVCHADALDSARRPRFASCGNPHQVSSAAENNQPGAVGTGMSRSDQFQRFKAALPI